MHTQSPSLAADVIQLSMSTHLWNRRRGGVPTELSDADRAELRPAVEAFYRSAVAKDVHAPDAERLVRSAVRLVVPADAPGAARATLTREVGAMVAALYAGHGAQQCGGRAD